MSKILYEEINDEAIERIQKRVEMDSRSLMRVVNEIIGPYCKDLDNYVMFIKDCLQDGERPPTNEELDDFCMNLSTLIYFAGGMCEQLGIKDDISKAIYKEVYNSERDRGQGTVADKDSLAELASQQELLTNVCFNRAYRIMKAKIDAAQELLGSVKKVLTRRMTEMELTRISQ